MFSQLRAFTGLAALALLCAVAVPLCAQDKPAGDDPTSGLVVEQEGIRLKFKQLEDRLLDLADAIKDVDPDRAELLKKAFEEAGKRNFDDRMTTLVQVLRDKRFSVAVRDQTKVRDDMEELLKLLMTERDKTLTDERARIKEYLKRINELIRKERELRDIIGRGGDPNQTAGRQGNVADDTKKLEGDIAKNEGKGKEGEGEGKGKGKEGEGEGKGKGMGEGEGKGKGMGEGEGEGKGKGMGEGEGKGKGMGEGEGKGKGMGEGEGKGKGKGMGEGEGKGKGKGMGEGEGKGKGMGMGEGEGKGKGMGEGEGKGKGKGMGEGEGKGKGMGEGEGEGKGKGKGKGMGMGEGEGGEGGESEESEEAPEEEGSDPIQNTRQRIANAEKKMRAAKQKLEKAQREGAAKDAEKAEEELRKAAEELEELLRQLREEELERLLAYLEARFQTMLKMQVAVYEGTLRLDRVPEPRRDADFEFQSAKLSRQESLIVIEADKVLRLLGEDGTSVAMPEAVRQMKNDMLDVVRLLGQKKTGDLTQGIEEDIIEALEEMIAALQKKQKELQDQKQGKQPPPGQPGDQALIDMLAELKMLRALEMRVRRSTGRAADSLENPEDEIGQATKQDLQERLDQLAERQERIFRATKDIATGKNQ